MLFLGRYEYSMDDRGRVPMPARFREAFAAGAVLSPAPARCLRVYTTATYEQAAMRVLHQGAHTALGQQLRRGFFSSTHEAEIDKAGRLLVPASLRQRLGFEGSVTLIGCGEYLELWESGACASELATVQEHYPELLSALGGEA